MNFGELIRHPAVITGLVRAVLILLVTYNFPVSEVQQRAILEVVGQVLVVASILISVGTVATTQPKPAAADEVVIKPPER